MTPREMNGDKMTTTPTGATGPVSDDETERRWIAFTDFYEEETENKAIPWRTSAKNVVAKAVDLGLLAAAPQPDPRPDDGLAERVERLSKRVKSVAEGLDQHHARLDAHDAALAALREESRSISHHVQAHVDNIYKRLADIESPTPPDPAPDDEPMDPLVRSIKYTDWDKSEPEDAALGQENLRRTLAASLAEHVAAQMPDVDWSTISDRHVNNARAIGIIPAVAEDDATEDDKLKVNESALHSSVIVASVVLYDVLQPKYAPSLAFDVASPVLLHDAIAAAIKTYLGLIPAVAEGLVPGLVVTDRIARDALDVYHGTPGPEWDAMRAALEHAVAHASRVPLVVDDDLIDGCLMRFDYAKELEQSVHDMLAYAFAHATRIPAGDGVGDRPDVEGSE